MSTLLTMVPTVISIHYCQQLWLSNPHGFGVEYKPWGLKLKPGKAVPAGSGKAKESEKAVVATGSPTASSRSFHCEGLWLTPQPHPQASPKLTSVPLHETSQLLT